MREKRIIIFFAIFSFFAACAKDEEKKKEEKELQSTKEEKESPATEEVNVSGERKTFFNSNSQNPLTLHIVNREKAEALVASLESSSKGDKPVKKDLEALMSAERLAGRPPGQLMEVGKKLAMLEMAKNIENDISDEVKLELSLSAIKNREFSLAEFFLEDILKSKNDKIKAGAMTALGIIALLEEKIPEAVKFWKNALKAVPGYRAAKINLGIIAIRHGDAKTALENLADVQDDPFAQYGLAAAERLAGNSKATDAICKKMVQEKPNYKPALYNCAIHEFQSNNDYKKAKELIDRTIKSKASAAETGKIDELALKFAEIMEKEVAADKEKRAADDKLKKQSQPSEDPKKKPAAEQEKKKNESKKGQGKDKNAKKDE